MARKKYFTLILFLLSVYLNYALPNSCFSTQVESQDCFWYSSCLEAKYQCGKNGYPVGFGLKYCQKFGQLKSYPAVRSWVEKTTICLKEKLVPLLKQQTTMNCHELKKTAFQSHPICYDEGGFCYLFKELGVYESSIFIKQLLELYDMKDFQSAAAAKQVEVMIEKCFEQIFPRKLKRSIQ